MKKLSNKLILMFAMLALGGVAVATTGGAEIATDAFDAFMDTMMAWAGGGLGIGLAVTSLLIGGGIGLMRSSPMPALGGVALAALFAWGPGIISGLISNGTAALIA